MKHIYTIIILTIAMGVATCNKPKETATKGNLIFVIGKVEITNN